MRLFSALYLLICIIACIQLRPLLAETKVKESKPKLGLIIPLSGPFAVFGRAIRTGLQLGGLDDKDSPFELVFEDSGYDTKQAIMAYNRLRHERQVDLLYLFGSPAAAAILPIHRKADQPIFLWAPSKRTTEGYVNAMRLATSADQQGKAIAANMVKKGFKKVAVFTAENEYCQSILDGFNEQLTAQSTVIMSRTFDPTDQDFKATLVRLRTVEHDGIFLCLTAPQISSIARQTRDLKIETTIFGCHMMSSTETLISAGKQLDGAWMVEGEINPNFDKKYLETDPDDSGIWIAAATYDLSKLLLTLHKKGISPKDYLAHAVGQCLINGGFKSNCVRQGENLTKYFETPLAVTYIRNSKFIRMEQ